MRPARPFVLLAEAYLAFIVLLEVGVTLTAAAMHNLNGAHAAWMIGASCIALAALDVARRAPSPSTP